VGPVRGDERAGVVLPIDRQRRDLLIGAEPVLFHLTEHCRDSAAVLVRLRLVSADRLAALREDSWRSATPKDLVG